MKIVALFPALLLSASPAFAVSQNELTLLPKCEEKIRAAVTAKYGADDETFSIVGLKLVYGGSKRGLHMAPVVIVRTSDEVDPRDVLVVTKVNGDQDAREHGCRIESVITLEDGLLPEVDGLEG